MLVFCADNELKVKHDSVCDGMFEMVPDSSYQLFILHGYSNGEGMTLAWALLPNKSTAIYVEMFTSIHDPSIQCSAVRYSSLQEGDRNISEHPAETSTRR